MNITKVLVLILPLFSVLATIIFCVSGIVGASEHCFKNGAVGLVIAILASLVVGILTDSFVWIKRRIDEGKENQGENVLHDHDQNNRDTQD